MKKRIALFLTVILMLSFMTGCNSNKKESTGNKKTGSETTDTTDKTTETEKEKSMEYGNVTLFERDACSYDTAVLAGVQAVSLEAVQKLNDNHCTVLYNDKGNISFINGNYTDYKVTNVQEAYNSLMAVQGLLNLPMESIAPIKMMQEENVGTYYMFGKQENGSFQKGWVLHVIVDSKHMVQGLGIGHGDSEFYYSNDFTSHEPNYSSNEFFDSLTADEAKAKDINGNEVTIPVMYSEEQDTYYMGDLDRRIVVGVFEENLAQGAIYPFLESKDNTWNDPQAVTVLNDLIKVYDFFAEELGIYSVDGSGIPIMFYVHGSMSVGSNADYCGITRDYAWFNISDELVGNIVVLAHEFAHGIFGSNSMGAVYVNDTGSINEGYADLFGALVKAYFDENDTVNWYEREEFPNHEGWYSACPDTINSWKYKIPTAIPTEINDMGGVHHNAALVTHLLNGLEKNHGLTKEEQLKLWKTTLSFLISDENYATLKQQLLLSAKLHGHEDWCKAIETEFANLGFPAEITKDWWVNATDEGCGRLTVNYDYDMEMEMVDIPVMTEDYSFYESLYKNTAGTISKLIPAGTYQMNVVCMDLSTGKVIRYLKEPLTIEIKEGETTVIDGIPEESFVVKEKF